MATSETVTLFHAPRTRSTGVLTLLEEMGVPYKLHPLNRARGEQRSAEYLAVNPMGKVPALRHGGTVITEQVAIVIYLGDLFPETSLAPPIGDPARGSYLRWLVFYAACYEPAVVDRSMKREPAPPAMSPYGDFDTMFETLVEHLSRNPYILGERFSAADVLWGSALAWTSLFKLIPERPVLADYVERVTSRPAFARAKEIDARLLAEQEAAKDG